MSPKSEPAPQSPRGSLCVVQVSDMHLDPDNRTHLERFELVRDIVREARPDLLVFSGDVSDDGYAHEDRLERVRDLLETMPRPRLVLPGNHDIGNKIGAGLAEVTPAHLDTWRRIMGPDHAAWSHGGWTILTLNSQIIGSGFPQEDEQLAWLDDQLAEAQSAGHCVGVFMHMPLFLGSPRERLSDVSFYWVPPRKARDAMMERLTRPHVRLVATGHVHWGASRRHGSALWTWCPAASDLIVHDKHFPSGGNVLGLMKYTLAGSEVKAEMLPLPIKAREVEFIGPKY